METGKDMEKLKAAVRQVLPELSGCKLVYAHWERSETYGRKTTTYYYTYAIAFDAAQMWIIPLKYEKDSSLPQQPVRITADNVGVADMNETRKNDQLSRVTVLLRDKDGSSPLEFYVDAQNLKSDRFHHFNIKQPEECEAFARFMGPLAQKVTAENGEVRECLAAEELEGRKKSGKTFGILSLVLCWLPLAGLVFGVIGLLSAPKPKETGGKAVPGFILSCAGLGLSLLLSVGGYILIILS